MTALEHAEVGHLPQATLAENEAVIERGLQSFVSVGNALLSIKLNKQYRDAGYPTFEDYCSKRWQISRSRGYQLVTAAATVEALYRDLPEVSTTVDIPVPLPTNERQVRPLESLPEAERAEAWTAAVVAAAGEPTGEQVQAEVDRRLGKSFPAQQPSRHPESTGEVSQSDTIADDEAMVGMKLCEGCTDYDCTDPEYIPPCHLTDEPEFDGQPVSLTGGLPAEPEPPAPRPFLTDAQRAENERIAYIDRRVKGLQRFCSGWGEFKNIQTDNRRAEILAALTPGDREIVLRAEGEISWRI